MLSLNFCNHVIHVKKLNLVGKDVVLLLCTILYKYTCRHLHPLKINIVIHTISFQKNVKALNC